MRSKATFHHVFTHHALQLWRLSTVKVILQEDVSNLGEAGTVEEVADGYARNYLIPQGLAVQATPGALKAFKNRQAAQARKQERIANRAEALADRLASITLSFEAKAGATGRLYGSITKAEIAESLAGELGEEVDKREITMPEPIRELGEHFVFLNLMGDVEPRIRILVKPESGEWPEDMEPPEE
jgi:large subunit ribosomal protein L9